MQLPLRITESSEVLTVEDFIGKFNLSGLRCCSFIYILCFRNGQFQFYISELLLRCDDHARLFTESATIAVPSDAASLCSQQSCLKFLSSLYCDALSGQTVKTLGAVIGNCEHLSRIEVGSGDDSICYLLEQVRNPSKCSLMILADVGINLTSAGAVQLASVLPKFNNVITLSLDLSDCDAATLDTLVTNITHKTLKELILRGLILTPAATKALGRSLPEMLSLRVLELTGVDGSILQAEELEALFGGFNKTMPLLKLTFSGFSVRGCLAPLIKCLLFFPNLRELELERLNMDEHDLCDLLKSLGFICDLTKLEVCTRGESFHYYTSRDGLDDRVLKLGVRSLTPAVSAMLGRLLPGMSSLKVLEIIGVRESPLQAEEMQALFGGFNKPMPLCQLTLSGFRVRGRLASLFRSIRFFPSLIELDLEKLNMDEHDLRGLLESFQFIPDLQELNLSGNPLGHSVTSIVPHVIKLKKLQCLRINNTGHSEEDLNYVRDTVQQTLPELEICVGTSDVQCNLM